MSCWNDGKDGKLSWNDGGSEKGNVGLQFAVFDVRRVNNALNKMIINFFSLFFAGCDDIFWGSSVYAN